MNDIKVAEKENWAFLNVSSSQILDKFVGETGWAFINDVLGLFINLIKF